MIFLWFNSLLVWQGRDPFKDTWLWSTGCVCEGVGGLCSRGPDAHYASAPAVIGVLEAVILRYGLGIVAEYLDTVDITF